METTINKTVPNPKARKKKIIIIALGVAATGVLSYFGWQFIKNRKSKLQSALKAEDNFQLPSPPAAQTFIQAQATPSKAQRNDNFPLKKGSYGPKVQALQLALAAAPYNISIKPDGDFGSKTVAALQKAGFGPEVDETTYNVIVVGGGLDAADLATKLYTATKSKNLADSLTHLKQLKSVADYKAVNEEFKKKPNLTKFDNNSLVNGMLYSFPDENQKQKIRVAFTNVGLKYDGKKWSLSGLGGMRLITTASTVVWKNPKLAIKVPANMVLGEELARRDQYSVFENNGRKFLVKTSTIKYV